MQLPPSLKTLFSADRSLSLTPTERFTQWSSLVYVLLGTSMLLIPSLWANFWQAELVGRTSGYIQLGGLSLAIEGFLLIVASRSRHRVPGHGHINITVFTRIVLINLAAWKLFQAGTAPVRYLFFFVALDNSLAVGTFLVWIFTEKDATLVLFFKEIAGLVFRFPSGSWSSFAVLVTGIVQFAGGVYLKNVEHLRSALNLDPSAGYSDTFLGFHFSLSIAHAVLYIFNGQAVSRSFNASCVFYRVAINMPLVFLLAVTGKVELILSVFLMCADFTFAMFILVFLYCDDINNKEKK